jgi:Fic family protein
VKLLKQHIETKGIRVNEIALHLGVTQSYVSRLLSGERVPSTEHLKLIADFTGINYVELLKEHLGNQIYKLVKDYPEVAGEAMIFAEERVKYLRSSQKMIPIEVDESIHTKLSTIDQLQAKWTAAHPINIVQLQKLREYFHTSYTFESNRIEGNTLTLQETHMVINEGITIGGKTMSEHLEAINHKEAIELIYALVEADVPLTSHRLKQIHQLILKGVDSKNAGRYRHVNVRISGSEHLPPDHFELDSLMTDYFKFYEQHRHQMHPVLLAAEMHERLVTIHPFVDGNGRTARLIMNLILLQNGYTIANLKGSLEDRLRYYKALEAVQLNHEKNDFYQLIADHVLLSLEEHIALV